MAAVSFTLPAYSNAAPGEGCAACSRVFDFHDEALIPILLGCGHVLCFECLEPIFDWQLDNDGYCHCSQCPSPVVYARHPALDRATVLTARYNTTRQCAEVSIALHGEQEPQGPVFTHLTPDPFIPQLSTEPADPLPPPFPQLTPAQADSLPEAFPQLAETPGRDVFLDFQRWGEDTPAPDPAPAQQAAPPTMVSPAPVAPVAPAPVAPAPAAPAPAAPPADVEPQLSRRSGRRHTLTARAQEFWDDVHLSRRGSRG